MARSGKVITTDLGDPGGHGAMDASRAPGVPRSQEAENVWNRDKAVCIEVGSFISPEPSRKKREDVQGLMDIVAIEIGWATAVRHTPPSKAARHVRAGGRERADRRELSVGQSGESEHD